jgi:hypothetical protein
MPVPVGNEGFITDADVRIYLRDNDPEANKLIGDLEFSPEEIRTAWTLTVDRWNEWPPNVGIFTVDTFPYRYHLLMGVSANLLTIAASRYRRNNLVYNVPGGSINDQDKAGSYGDAADKLAKEFGTWMQHKKIELQMNMGWGLS